MNGSKMLKEIREPVVIEKGKAAVLDQLASLGKSLIRSYPKIRRAGIASAGPLDPFIHAVSFMIECDGQEEIDIRAGGNLTIEARGKAELKGGSQLDLKAATVNIN